MAHIIVRWICCSTVECTHRTDIFSVDSKKSERAQNMIVVLQVTPQLLQVPINIEQVPYHWKGSTCLSAGLFFAKKSQPQKLRIIISREEYSLYCTCQAKLHAYNVHAKVCVPTILVASSFVDARVPNALLWMRSVFTCLRALKDFSKEQEVTITGKVQRILKRTPMLG